MIDKIIPTGSDSGAELLFASQLSRVHVYAMARRQQTAQGTTDQISVAVHYMNARLVNNPVAAMATMASSVRLISQRDGSFEGVSAVGAYLRRTPPEGHWSRPYFDTGSGLICFDGFIKLERVVPVNLKGYLLFNDKCQIEEIFVGKS